MRRHLSPMIVAALALSLLTACSADKGTSATPAGDSTGASRSAAPGVPATPADNGAGKIGIDQPDPSKAIFSKQFALPGNPQRKVTVGILSLERKDTVAILKLVVTPDFADLPASELIGFQKSLGESVGSSGRPRCWT